MTEFKPYIILNELLITTHTGAIAYNEKFHLGVNIIRGQNSSGKSTIANFIFYALGGDFSNWTTEAIKCRDVFAEVNLSGSVITLKRQVGGGLQPMSIYWGKLEDAKSNQMNWKTFPYKQTADTLSFSNVLFDILGMPQVKSDSDSNITMHQLLRLLYIDQDSPTQSLFRFERFDLPLTRLTIAELLLGIYDDSLYSMRIEVKAKSKELEQKNNEITAIQKAYFRAAEYKPEGIAKLRASESKKLEELEAEIEKTRISPSLRTSKKTKLPVESIQAELSEVKARTTELQSSVSTYELDIADSYQFITALEKRVKDLDDSLLTRKVLGELPLTYCPNCLSALDETNSEEHCILCKKPYSAEEEKANAQRLRNEMILQIKESKSLVNYKTEKLLQLKEQLSASSSNARALQKQLDDAIIVTQSSRDGKLDEMLIEKGKYIKNLENLDNLARKFEILDVLQAEATAIENRIGFLRKEIGKREQNQLEKYTVALNTIKSNTLTVLKEDLDRQLEFKSARSVEVDYHKDTYLLDDQNNFSASSKVYFKNAVLFSIFFGSLKYEFFRYPRFILCDNMEDKGMEKERTQNFQNIITRMSGSSDIKHQIIFTTSMISDDLNNAVYCIGDSYNSQTKTLRV